MPGRWQRQHQETKPWCRLTLQGLKESRIELIARKLPAAWGRTLVRTTDYWAPRKATKVRTSPPIPSRKWLLSAERVCSTALHAIGTSVVDSLPEGLFFESVDQLE